QPALDKLLDDLSRIDPKLIAERLSTIRTQARKLSDENAALRANLAKNEGELARLNVQMNLLDALVKARSMSPAGGSPGAPAQMPGAGAATPPHEMPAKSAPAEMPAKAPAAPKPAEVLINYTDHILPIVNEKCAGCHNPDKARGGLVLVT